MDVLSATCGNTAAISGTTVVNCVTSTPLVQSGALPFFAIP